MIIIIKGNNKKQLIIKALSMLSLVIMFYFYYGHMSDKFKLQNDQIVNKLKVKPVGKVNTLSVKLEDIIYKEAVVVVDLINQKHIRSIKIVKGKLLVICDYDTDIEPVMIRYGVNALIKNTTKNIKIALDLRIIVENKYEA